MTRTQVVTQGDLEAMNMQRSRRSRTPTTRYRWFTDRAGRCKIARFRLNEARQIIEHAFR